MSSYIRKTTDEWQLLVDYGHGYGFEEVTAEYTRKEIKQRQKEYRENEPGYPSKIKCVRMPKHMPKVIQYHSNILENITYEHLIECYRTDNRGNLEEVDAKEVIKYFNRMIKNSIVDAKSLLEEDIDEIIGEIIS